MKRADRAEEGYWRLWEASDSLVRKRKIAHPGNKGPVPNSNSACLRKTTACKDREMELLDLGESENERLLSQGKRRTAGERDRGVLWREEGENVSGGR